MRALFLALVILAGTASPARDILEKVEEKYAGISTVSADFYQKITYSATKEQSVFAGRVLMAKPDRMRMSVLSPDTQLLVSSGDSLWIYIKETNQVFLYDLKDASYPQVGTLIFRMSNEFGGELRAKSRESYEMKLLARQESKYYDSLYVRISRRSYLVTHLTIFDKQANRIEYGFTRMKTNARIDDSQFRFTPPPGAEVIKQR